MAIQAELTPALGLCRLDAGALNPCSYHMDRLNCSLLALKEEGLPIASTPLQEQLLSPGSEQAKLARLFESSRPPAGSWYLASAQRSWLASQLADTFESAAHASTIRIALAGIAGPAHFYGFLLVLSDALAVAGRDQRVHLLVIERCPLPLQGIAACERVLADEWRQEFGRHRDARRPKQLTVGGLPLYFGYERAITPASRRFGEISVELVESSLLAPRLAEQIGQLDLICEHFLTSFLTSEEQGASREAYVELLRPGGVLLSASGAGNGAAFDFVHEDVGLSLMSRAWSWDPYDLSREQLFRLSAGMPVETEAANSLSRWQSKRP